MHEFIVETAPDSFWAGNAFTVRADKVEFEMSGGVSFYHVNDETVLQFAMPPGSWRMIRLVAP